MNPLVPAADEHPVTVARKAKGWRLEDLSARCGHGLSKLSNIENGLVPKPQTALDIAAALNANVHDLWPGQYEERPA